MTLALAGLLAAPAALYLLVRIARSPVEGAYAFIFLSAITITPGLPMVGDRLAFADLVMTWTIAVAALRGILLSPPPAGRRLADQLGLVFIVLCTVSSLLALLGGGEPKRLLLFSCIYIYGYLCFRVLIRLIDSDERLFRACLAWGAGAAMIVVVGVAASSGLFRPAWTFDPVTNRISATMRLSGQVSSYLGPAFFVFCALASLRCNSALRRLVAIVLLGGACVVMVGTGSRLSFAIMVLSVLLCVVLVATSPRGLVRRTPIFGLAVVGALAFGLYAVAIWGDRSEAYGLVTTSPFERALRIFAETSREAPLDVQAWGGSRYSETTFALANMWRHPLFGTGSGMFSPTYRLNEVHNTYVSILAENGVLAFVAFLAWWSVIFSRLWYSAFARWAPERRFVTRFVLAAFVTIALYQVTTNGMRQRPFWIGSALALCAAALHRRTETAPQDPWQFRAVPA